MGTLVPRDAADIRDAVASAADSGRTLEIVGGGSKVNFGNPNRQADKLSTAGLAKVIDYDPPELVLTVEPGVRLADLEAMLVGHNQMFAFEPYDFAGVIAGEPGLSTIGGVVCGGLAGSRRISAGSVRDHVLGFSAINGRGESFKAGGKVVKNVTGYDLPKLVAGSWGRLAVLTEITLKVLPKPPVTRTLVLHGLSNQAALDVMTRAMGSQAEVAAASHFPASRKCDAITSIRIEGFGPSVDAREKMLKRSLVDAGEMEVLDGTRGDARWTRTNIAADLDAVGRPVLWRICTPPSQGAKMLSSIAELGGVALLDWAGGLCWARVPIEAAAATVRELAERAGGHATLIHGPDNIRAITPALHPEPPSLAALSKRVRQAFDPAGVFDTGRFAAP
ncbi:MAG: FAD-binding protein [Hyphomonadaceae bacterium]|nr:FAD-binding protein [Hyphomonadaceae bacterium]